MNDTRRVNGSFPREVKRKKESGNIRVNVEHTPWSFIEHELRVCSTAARFLAELACEPKTFGRGELYIYKNNAHERESTKRSAK